MPWLGLLFAMLGLLAAGAAQSLTPPLDSRPAFFAGDWIGTGSRDTLCFLRLQPDGSGTLLVGGASGDWQGARLRWRNQRQTIELLELSPLPADPSRRLMPLAPLTLHSGVNQTIQLMRGERLPLCELQRQIDVQRRAGEAAALLAVPADASKAHGGN